MTRSRAVVVSLFALCVGVPCLTEAQPPSSVMRERGRAMLEQLRRDVSAHYFDPSFGGVPLDSHVAIADARIKSAASVDEIFYALAQVPLELGDSHTFFIPPMRAARVDYGWSMRMIGDTCMVIDVRESSDAAAQGLRRGDIVETINGYRPTRANRWQLRYVFGLLRPQAGLRVVVRSPNGEPRQLDLAAKVKPRRRIMDLTGKDGGRDFWELLYEASENAEERRSEYSELGSDVLLWRLAEFNSDRWDVRTLVKKAKSRKALVLDLRGNGGGAVTTLLWLLGQLYERDTDVATLIGRRDTTTMTAKGAGGDRFAGTVVVLVDAESGSASELFARTLQLTKRGVVIGDTTAGAVRRSRIMSRRIGAETVVVYAVSVTTADVVMPDGARLEGRGVVPDEIIIPTASALAAGHDPALARALTLAGMEYTPGQAGTLRWLR